MIRAIIKKPGMFSMPVMIEDELSVYQKFVGGPIETIPLKEAENVVLIVNEEGKLRGLKPNFFYWADLLVGTVIAVGIDGEEFTDIPLGLREFEEIIGRWNR